MRPSTTDRSHVPVPRCDRKFVTKARLNLSLQPSVGGLSYRETPIAPLSRTRPSSPIENARQSTLGIGIVTRSRTPASYTALPSASRPARPESRETTN